MRASYTKAETTALVAVVFVVLFLSGVIDSGADWFCAVVFGVVYAWHMRSSKEAK